MKAAVVGYTEKYGNPTQETDDSASQPVDDESARPVSDADLDELEKMDLDTLLMSGDSCAGDEGEEDTHETARECPASPDRRPH